MNGIRGISYMQWVTSKLLRRSSTCNSVCLLAIQCICLPEEAIRLGWKDVENEVRIFFNFNIN